jgi:GTP-binding protein
VFRDECELEVRAAAGGDGDLLPAREVRALRRPDGGKGGDGGGVVLRADGSVNSLLRVGRRPIYEAEDGQQAGGPRNRSGSEGPGPRRACPSGTRGVRLRSAALPARPRARGRDVRRRRGRAGSAAATRASRAPSSRHHVARAGRRGRGAPRTLWSSKLIAEPVSSASPNAASRPSSRPSPGAPEGRGLSLHDACARGRDRRGGGQRDAGRGRPSGPDRGRARTAPGSVTVS